MQFRRCIFWQKLVKSYWWLKIEELLRFLASVDMSDNFSGIRLYCTFWAPASAFTGLQGPYRTTRNFADRQC